MLKRVYLLAIALLSTGCANFNYSIRSPDTQDHPVVRDADLVLPAPPAELRLRQVESRCVMTIENNGKDPVTLDGDVSAIIDPRGQSRAIAGRTIPPGSFIKIILPPLRDYEPQGPEFRIGIGVGMQVLAEPSPSPRRSFYLMPGSQSTEFWEWNSDGDVQILLGLKQNDVLTRHTYILRRSRSRD